MLYEMNIIRLTLVSLRCLLILNSALELGIGLGITIPDKNTGIRTYVYGYSQSVLITGINYIGYQAPIKVQAKY